MTAEAQKERTRLSSPAEGTHASDSKALLRNPEMTLEVPAFSKGLSGPLAIQHGLGLKARPLLGEVWSP